MNDGGALVIAPGETSREALIGSVRQGILRARFSGGVPSESGDIAGVAKNS